jgi:homoserine kinase type II
MATFTKLDDSTICELAAAFGLGDVASWTPIAAGTVNSNFRLDTARGRFFLRVNEGKDEKDVCYEADLVAALAHAGVPTPVPVRAQNGRVFAEYRGKYVSAFPWVEGGHLCQASVTPTHARAVAQTLARLHVVGLPLAGQFDRAGIYTFDHIVARFEGFRDQDDPAVRAVVGDLAGERDWLRGQQPVRAATPVGIIHGDLFRDNVLVHGPQVVALLDFEQASVGSLVYDLAVLANAWCYVDDDFDGALLRALVAGYQAERPLSPAERRAFPVECRAAAFRFTVTRITDVHLQDTSSTKDFRRYLARLQRWRERGPGEFAKLAGLDPS